MSTLRIRLLVALILLAVALQTSDAGEDESRRIDTGVSGKSPRVILPLALVA